MTTENNNQEMLTALKELKDAYYKVCELWYNSTNLDELDNSSYPFDKSFDEIGLADWVNSLLKQL